MTVGQNEQVVLEALGRLSGGPWTVTDLVRAEEIINDELCGGYGADCTTSSVLMWLRSLGEKEREEVVFRANAEWSRRQGTQIP